MGIVLSYSGKYSLVSLITDRDYSWGGVDTVFVFDGSAYKSLHAIPFCRVCKMQISTRQVRSEEGMPPPAGGDAPLLRENKQCVENLCSLLRHY